MAGPGRAGQHSNLSVSPGAAPLAAHPHSYRGGTTMSPAVNYRQGGGSTRRHRRRHQCNRRPASGAHFNAASTNACRSLLETFLKIRAMELGS